MSAYVISDVGPVAQREEAAWKAYLALAPAAIAKYGGRYLARGGAIGVMEGDWSGQPIGRVEVRHRRRLKLISTIIHSDVRGVRPLKEARLDVAALYSRRLQKYSLSFRRSDGSSNGPL